MKDIVFFNPFHNGDIHVSRSCVKHIVDSLPDVNFYYAHKNPHLLQDIPRLKEDINLYHIIGNRYKEEYFEIGDKLYINTWYAAGNSKYMNRYGITFDTIYDLFESHCKMLGVEYSDPVSMYPAIDYKYYQIEGIKDYVDRFWRKIFIFNGGSLSGQSTEFNMFYFITRLAEQNPDKHIFVSNADDRIKRMDNIHYTYDIIKKVGPCDLNENAYLASFCDFFIGRASGVHSFTLNRHNMFERDNFCMFTISNISHSGDYWIGDRLKDLLKYKSKILNYDVHDPHGLEVLVNQHLNDVKWRDI
jgi:hypothetical protein